MSINNLTPTQLRQAADLQEEIAKLQHQLAVLAGGKAAAPAPGAPAKAAKPARKKISAAGIARIKAAQKARWAKVNAAKGKPAAMAAPAAQPVKKARKKMSAEAKAKIAAAARARWARVRAEKAAKK
jgi:hypothetical protein